jgi:hypothetical protein
LRPPEPVADRNEAAHQNGDAAGVGHEGLAEAHTGAQEPQTA